MPDIIKLLPDSVANQIAAGEVIQRPSSVVKELTENSIDAGSLEINVIIRDSGKTLIQIIDDGLGMSYNDALLSFERHATSKISSANELFSITTKGFRGEALASIAAVSMVEMRTCCANMETGTLIVIEGSAIKTQELCACPKGTNISVKNLFFNVPARRKFLKTENTEFRHIVNEFQKIALSHPEVKFTLTHNDCEIYNLPATNLRQRIIGLFGKTIHQELVNIETDTAIVSVKGFIGKPESARKTYGEQFFFVNNRFMKHSYFHKAVMEAYRNLLPPDTIPAYFIYLTTDPANIDINIHPTKTEIKFEDERPIWQIIMASVKESLGRFNIAPAMDFMGDNIIDMPILHRNDTLSSVPKIKINPDYNPFDSNSSTNKQTKPYLSYQERDNLSHWNTLFSKNSDVSLNEDTITTAIDQSLQPKTVLFQLKNRYLISIIKTGLMIIDQHRAHERVLYEKFMKTIGGNPQGGQTTLFPETIQLTNHADYLILQEIANEIEKIGFCIELLDNNSIRIVGYPSSVTTTTVVDMFDNFISDFKSRGCSTTENVRENIAISMASSAAIPYGKPLEQCEMDELFDSLFACSEPSYSPKGKQIIAILSMEEISKLFIV